MTQNTPMPSAASFFSQGLREPAFLNTFFEALPLGVLIANTAGHIVYCNEAQARIDSMPRDFIMGKLETDLYGPYMGPGIMLACQQTDTPLLGYVCQYRTVMGKLVNGVYWVYPLHGETGQVIGSLCLTQLLLDKSPLLPARQHVEPEDGPTVTTAHARHSPDEKNDGSGTGTQGEESEQHRLVGSNPAFRRMLNIAETTASSPSPVMISGETGTGKEMVVRTIRKASNRSNKPYQAINCSAIPATLLEVILFGSTRGSFTGAENRPGLFEQANGGIVYLDEIDSMPLELQPKLLRVLQDMCVRRLGSSEERSLDIKVISSIGDMPETILAGGKLRSDLFYRLAVITLYIPPLRERKDDLDKLITHFVGNYNTVLGKHVSRIDPEVRKLFHLYDWPGNVRELEHVIAGAINVTAWEEDLCLHHIQDHHRYYLEKLSRWGESDTADAPSTTETEPGSPEASPTSPELEHGTLAHQEGEAIRTALRKNAGHATRAAKSLGISRQLLNYKMKKYHINRKSFAEVVD